MRRTTAGLGSIALMAASLLMLVACQRPGSLRSEIQPYEARIAELGTRRHRHPVIEEVLLRVGCAQA